MYEEERELLPKVKKGRGAPVKPIKINKSGYITL